MTSMEVEPAYYGPDQAISSRHELRELFADLFTDINEIKRKIEFGGFDIDMYKSDNGTKPDGKTTLNPTYNKPIMIQHIIAFWDSTSNVASMTIADRIIPLPQTAGFIEFDCAIQMQKDDPCFLQVQIGKACHFEVMGTSDYRKMDRS
jgi:hypothetical protein